MAIPTSRFPTWATDGGADVTDPGSSKQATGWVEGEAPAADHTNWLHNARGEWLEHLADSMALRSMMNGLDFTGSDGGVTVGDTQNLYYLPGVDKWYAFVDDSGTVDLYDSADGETWSSAETESWDMTASVPGNFTEDGTKVYVAAGDSGIGSTTGSIASVSLESNTFANLVNVYRIIWDDVNSVFIAAGQAAANAEVETATAMGGTWTQRITKSNTQPMACLAHNPQDGYTVAVEVGASEYVYTTNGTSWSTDTSPTFAPINVYYNDVIGKFVFHSAASSSQKLGFTSDGTDYFEIDFGGGDPFYNLVNTPVGILAMETSATDMQKVYLITSVDHSTDDNLLIADSMEFNVGTAGHFISAQATGQMVFDCTSGATGVTHRKAIWNYDSTSYWAIAKY